MREEQNIPASVGLPPQECRNLQIVVVARGSGVLSFAQGGFALVMLYDQIKGHPIPEAQDNVKLKLLPLTKDRVAQFEADFPGGVPPYDFKAHSQVYTPSAKAASFELNYSK